MAPSAGKQQRLPSAVVGARAPEKRVASTPPSSSPAPQLTPERTKPEPAPVAIAKAPPAQASAARPVVAEQEAVTASESAQPSNLDETATTARTPRAVPPPPVEAQPSEEVAVQQPAAPGRDVAAPAAPAIDTSEPVDAPTLAEPVDPPVRRVQPQNAPTPPRARVATLNESRESAAKPALTGTSSEIRQLLGLTGSTPSGAVSVGEFVDASVPLKPLPAAIKALRPYYAELQYAVIGDTAVFVYPATRRVFVTY